MARRKDSPQKVAVRGMVREYLKNKDISIKNGTDVNSIMRGMISVMGILKKPLLAFLRCPNAVFGNDGYHKKADR